VPNCPTAGRVKQAGLNHLVSAPSVALLEVYPGASVVSHITLQIGRLVFPPGPGGSGLDLLHLDPRAIDLFDDALDGGAPDERLGVLVPGSHKCLDLRRSAVALRGKMHGRTYLHVQSRGL